MALASQLRTVPSGAAVDLQEALHRVTMVRHFATQTYFQARCICPFFLSCPARLQPGRWQSRVCIQADPKLPKKDITWCGGAAGRDADRRLWAAQRWRRNLRPAGAAAGHHRLLPGRGLPVSRLSAHMPLPRCLHLSRNTAVHVGFAAAGPHAAACIHMRSQNQGSPKAPSGSPSSVTACPHSM